MANFPEDLRDRYHRFKFRHFTPNQEHYEELASEGQHPDTMVVSCCDSRCDPETIFSAMPGELFVVRNVANLVHRGDLNLLSVLEFAVETLEIKHIIVCGHHGCGGIRAAMDGHRHGIIDHWLQPIRDVADAVRRNLPRLTMSNRDRTGCAS